MARLFISLYFFIALSLIGLSAGLERIFYTQPESNNNQVLLSIFETASHHNLPLTDLLQQAKLPYKLLSKDDIAWPEADANTLNNGHAVMATNAQGVAQIYMLTERQQLLEISLPNSQPASPDFMLYSLAFFALLGVVIALWLWPLWRDLSVLDKTVSHVLPDGSINKIAIEQQSLIYPIATSINNMGAKIAHLMQQQKELSSAVAHEFRTPLARLKFALAMRPSAQSQPWQDMHQDVNELERLVQEMLDFASTDAQAPEMNLAEIPIKQLCQHIVERLKDSHLDPFNIDIQGNDVTILADEHFIDRAISNLLINASRFATHIIVIKIEQTQDNIQIAIEDDGEGVAPHLREKIFSAFYRPDESRNRQQGGAGLGLAIVKRITDWHQGQCFVKDSKLGGAKFVLLLPNPLTKT